jgi:outer membrane lipoprotein-sorting protein
MIKKRFNFYYYASAFFLIGISFHAAYGASANPDTQELFRRIIKENSKIQTIDSEITQYITVEQNPQEIYRGRYRADSQGRFRIDFSVPSEQLVLNDGRTFLWYYPGSKVLYQIERHGYASHNAGFNPMIEFSKEFEKRYEVTYLGKQLYGFFNMAHLFIVRDKEKGIKLDIRIDAKMNTILAKVVRDEKGMEIMKEIYEDYKLINSVNSPARVVVTARTKSGITKNITEYSKITLNRNIPPAIFYMQFPVGITRKNIYE